MQTVDKLEAVSSIRRILDQCVGIAPGEQVLIVTDSGFNFELAELFAICCAERDAEVATMVMRTRDHVGDLPPPMVVEAMKTSDVVLEMCKIWVGSAPSRIEACKAGARYCTWPALDEIVLRKNGPAWADFEGLHPHLMALDKKFTEAKRVRVETKAGTRIEAVIEGRQGRTLSGICREKGRYEAPPHMEVGIGPIEDSTQGVIVVDGRVQHTPFGEVTAPFEMSVEGGRITEIRSEGGGKVFADFLRDALAAYQDPNIYVIAEIALGMNPKANRLDRDMEGESGLGTAHFGIGDNIGYGGTNKAPGHRDCVVRDVTFFLDDELIVKDGVIQLEGFPI